MLLRYLPTRSSNTWCSLQKPCTCAVLFWGRVPNRLPRRRCYSVIRKTLGISRTKNSLSLKLCHCIIVYKGHTWLLHKLGILFVPCHLIGRWDALPCRQTIIFQSRIFYYSKVAVFVCSLLHCIAGLLDVMPHNLRCKTKSGKLHIKKLNFHLGKTNKPLGKQLVLVRRQSAHPGLYEN
jgi:hypothetical protein